MPTIVFVSPKGGAGKTTSALVLAEQIARSEQPLQSSMQDPNHPIKTWAEGTNTPPNLIVVSDADEENMMKRIEEAAARTPFVIVDLEGTAAKIVLLAVSQADLVIVPTQGSQLDAAQASRALKVLRQQEKMSRRTVPYGIVSREQVRSSEPRRCRISANRSSMPASTCLARNLTNVRHFAPFFLLASLWPTLIRVKYPIWTRPLPTLKNSQPK